MGSTHGSQKRNSNSFFYEPNCDVHTLFSGLLGSKSVLIKSSKENLFLHDELHELQLLGRFKFLYLSMRKHLLPLVYFYLADRCSNSLYVQGHERVGLLSVQFGVVEQDFLAAYNHKLRRK